ncbi:hypothetical protein Cocul_01488 [Corynebacterium oculi]|uniref:Uncharacterized protein n=1 Tax=Corynebacterium oculi TaxID=1544416 RepID=A0A0Q0Z5B9_9CORY|nr:hypothetical protein Cocul_01488 [Corynebacterium oculi]
MGLPEGVSLGMVAAVTVLLRQLPYSAKKVLRRSRFMGTWA